jgi:hypothetical protein
LLANRFWARRFKNLGGTGRGEAADRRFAAPNLLRPWTWLASRLTFAYLWAPPRFRTHQLHQPGDSSLRNVRLAMLGNTGTVDGVVGATAASKT